MVTAVLRHQGSKKKEHGFVDTVLLAMGFDCRQADSPRMETSSRQQSSGLQQVCSDWRFEAWAPKDAPSYCLNTFEFASAI